MNKLGKGKVAKLATSTLTAGYLMVMTAQTAFAADGTAIQGKLTTAANTIKGILGSKIVKIEYSDLPKQLLKIGGK